MLNLQHVHVEALRFLIKFRVVLEPFEYVRPVTIAREKESA